MAGPFDLKPIWANEHFSIKRGVLKPKTTLPGMDLGQGVIYYPGAEGIAHRILSDSGEEAVVSETGRQLRFLWNPGHATQIINYGLKPRDLFLIELKYNPLLGANLLSGNDAAGAVSHLLHGGWPQAFRSSVEMDLQAIGQLGITHFWNPFGRTSRSIHRATRAKEDLEFKIAWVAARARATDPTSFLYRAMDYFPFTHRSQAAPGFNGSLKVTVNTKDATGTRDVSGYEVWTNAWAAPDDMTFAERFSELSTPTTSFLVVGRYAMWAKKGNQVGTPAPIAIGIPDQTVDLLTP